MKHRTVLGFLIMVWVSAVSAGFATLWSHAVQPGKAAHAHADWPASSTIPRAAGRATLVVFAHPQCPCTWATLHELQRVMGRAGDKVSCSLVFERLPGTSKEWAQTPLRHAAEQVAGLSVREDNGREAKFFGASTSGQTVLYDAEGRLRFAGGLTEARAHEGDNTGEDAVIALLNGQSSGPQRVQAVIRTPVFGCSFR